MINLFIDTNIFLRFYGFSNDYLDKLEKLISLIKEEKIKLFLPQQVIDEFNRNRENVLKETLKRISSCEPKLLSPVICHDCDEMKEIQKLLKSIDKLKNQLVKNLTKGIKSKSLKADKLIEEIFSISPKIEISDDILNKAKKRFELGNPPGKRNSYGDSVNWECLLETLPNNEDIFFITVDYRDYSSDVDNQEFSPFLQEEWHNKKKAEVKYYDALSKFLKEKFPVVKITEKEIKEEKEGSLVVGDYLSYLLSAPSYPLDYSSLVGSGTSDYEKVLRTLLGSSEPKSDYEKFLDSYVEESKKKLK